MSGDARLARALRLAALAAAAAHLLVVLGIALARGGHPFELEWLEGGSLDHVRRLMEGRPLYGPPSLEFTPFMYTPLYYYVSAAFAHLLGLGLPALRAVSLLSSVVTLVLLGELVRRETGQLAAGFLAAGLYAATFRVSGSWFDVARVDALFVCLLVGSLFALRAGRASASAVAAGVLLALAVQTKQVGVLAAPTLAAAAWLSNRRRAAAFAGSFLVVAAATALVLDRTSNGWYHYYVFTLTRQHDLVLRQLAVFLARDLIVPFPLAIAVILAAAHVSGPHRAALRFHALAGSGFVAIALVSRMNVGGYHNVAMPAHTLLAILFGVAVGGLWRALDSRRLAAAVYAACLVQLALRGYDPRKVVPTQADRAAGEGLVEELRARPGPILVPSHPYLLPMAGHPGHAHQMALNDVLFNEGREEVRQQIVAPLREAIRRRRYRAVVLDAWFWFRPEVEGCYREESRAFREERAFWPVTGAPTRPESVYVPAGDGPCPDMPAESGQRPPPGASREARPSR